MKAAVELGKEALVKGPESLTAVTMLDSERWYSVERV
jgi:hypothetical protein